MFTGLDAVTPVHIRYVDGLVSAFIFGIFLKLFCKYIFCFCIGNVAHRRFIRTPGAVHCAGLHSYRIGSPRAYQFTGSA